MTTLSFEGHAKGGVEEVAIEIEQLVIVGWTGRDVAALNHHIEELKALGVQPPSSVPLYYRVSAQLLTQADQIQVVGGDTSGEAEPDRKAESYSVAVAKQVCAKAIGRMAWRFEEVEPHWDRLVLRSFIQDSDKRALYQEGPLANIRTPRELIAGWRGERRLPVGVAMFCGTLPAIGPIRPSGRFEIELEDPVLARKLTHSYHVQSLPIVA
jgi:hypothetical protein